MKNFLKDLIYTYLYILVVLLVFIIILLPCILYNIHNNNYWLLLYIITIPVLVTLVYRVLFKSEN
jgi:hypothetical protein